MKEGQKLTPMVVGYFLQGDEVLLGVRKKSEWKMGEKLRSGIGGKVGDLPGHAYETPDEALVRECEEEVHMTPTRYRRVGRAVFLFQTKPSWNQSVDIYLITEWSGEPQETDAVRPEWHKVDQMPFDLMWPDARCYVEQILGGRMVEATFTYGPDNSTIVEQHVNLT